MEISPNAFDASLLGIQKGQNMARQATQSITGFSSTGDTQQLTKDLVQFKQSELQVAASSKALKSADEMMGSLLDVKV